MTTGFNQIGRSFRLLCVAVCAIATSAIADTIFVDASATNGANTGVDWPNAYTSLQTALGEAASGDEVWVANGTYKPTTGSSQATAFELEIGVAIYGGFDGGATDEQNLSDRKLHQFEAIISGEINSASLDDNSQHIVRAGTLVNSDTDPAIIDGFTIVGGYADGTGDDAHGGGIYLENKGKVIVANIVFKNNHAEGNGGGLFIKSDGENNHDIALVNCTFIDNDADNGGGAWVAGRIEQVTNCAFAANTAFFEGGGLGNASGYPIIVSQCSFSRNDAGAANTRRGSGLYCAPGPDQKVHTDDSTADVRNCIFWENGMGTSETWLTAVPSNIEPECGEIEEPYGDGPFGWFYHLNDTGLYYIVNEILPFGELCEGQNVAIQGLLAEGSAKELIFVKNCQFNTLKYGVHSATDCGEAWLDLFDVIVENPTGADTYGWRGDAAKVRWRNGSFTNDSGRAILRLWGTTDGWIEDYDFYGGHVWLGSGVEDDEVNPVGLSNVTFRDCTFTLVNPNPPEPVKTMMRFYEHTHHVTFQNVAFSVNIESNPPLATFKTSLDLQGRPVEPWAHDVTFIDCTYNGTSITSANLPSLVNARGGLAAQNITVQAAPNPVEAQQFYAPNNYLDSIVRYSNIEGLDHFLDAEGSIGNIGNDPADDPLFADPFSNLRLMCNSPCIDAGSNALLPGEPGMVTGDAADLNYDNLPNQVLPRDLQLIDRKMDDPAISDTGAGTAPIVDMGAYEDRNCRPWYPDIWPRSGACPCGYGDAFVGAGDLAQLLSKWGLCAGCCEDIAPVGNPNGRVDAGDLAELLANWGPPPPDCGGEGFGGGGGDSAGDASDQDWPEVEMTDQLFDWITSAPLDEIWEWLWSLLEG